MANEQRPMTLAEFMLSQRQLFDQLRASYENTLSQLAQSVDNLQKENEQLKQQVQEKPPLTVD